MGNSYSRGGLRKNFRTIEELTDENKTLKKESLIDFLTGLPNSKALDLMIKALEKARDRAIRDNKEIKTGTFIAVDLDGLKKVNKAYGKSVGDIYLKNTANVLKGSVRQEDRVFRNGETSDEFTVYLPNIVEESDIGKVLDRFDDSIRTAEQSVQDKSKGVKFSLSYVAVRTGIPAGPEFSCWRAHDEMGHVKENKEKLTGVRGGNIGRIII
mgnify:FL=1